MTGCRIWLSVLLSCLLVLATAQCEAASRGRAVRKQTAPAPKSSKAAKAAPKGKNAGKLGELPVKPGPTLLAYLTDILIEEGTKYQEYYLSTGFAISPDKPGVVWKGPETSHALFVGARLVPGNHFTLYFPRDIVDTCASIDSTSVVAAPPLDEASARAAAARVLSAAQVSVRDMPAMTTLIGEVRVARYTGPIPKQQGMPVLLRRSVRVLISSRTGAAGICRGKIEFVGGV